ncbi:MAG: N-acetyltransferase [Actinomycetota bacterium]|nr:N-acetyltransferase [Actinomycetota bacterium]
MTTTSEQPANEAPHRLIRGCRFGDGVIVYSFTNLYGCEIGAGSRVGTFVEIQAGAVIGSHCKVESHTFICEGVSIGDGVFVGHGVIFINDKYPRARKAADELAADDDWDLLPVAVGEDTTIGSGALILGGVTIGREAMIGAGAVVNADVSDGATVAGVPARVR